LVEPQRVSTEILSFLSNTLGWLLN
jgi:hypothetical protein